MTSGKIDTPVGVNDIRKFLNDSAMINGKVRPTFQDFYLFIRDHSNSSAVGAE